MQLVALWTGVTRREPGRPDKETLYNVQDNTDAPTGNSAAAGLRKLQKAADEGNDDAAAQLVAVRSPDCHGSNWSHLTDVIAQLVMIDENLMRHELSPVERAEHVARRKELYEVLHPESANGATYDRGILRQNGEVSAPRFTKATAEATGISERTIRSPAFAESRNYD